MNVTILGSETTATFLSGATYHLLKSPLVLQKVTDEVRGTFKSADEITLASTIPSKMPYLHAVLEEGLRMYPPAPTKLPRRTTQETIINGAVVPANVSSSKYPALHLLLLYTITNSTIIPSYHLTTTPQTCIGVHQYASSHNAKFYHNPNNFEPARWLPSPPAPYDQDQLDAHQPFSIGPRNCLGKNLAYGEMRCIIARMLWNFDMSLAKDENGRELSEDWHVQKTYTLWVKGPLLVDLKVRE